MKKKILIFVCIICLLSSFCISISAMGVTTENSNTYSVFGAPETLTIRQMLFWELDNNEAFDSYATFNESISGEYLKAPNGDIRISAFKTTLSNFNQTELQNKALTLDKWLVTENNNKLTYMKQIVENIPTHDGSSLLYELTVIGDETKYIDKRELLNFITIPEINNSIGSTTQLSEKITFDLVFIRENTSNIGTKNTNYSLFEVSYDSTENNDMSTWLDNMFSANEQYGNIVGIRNYKISQQYKMNYSPELAQYVGFYTFDSKINSDYGNYDSYDFLTQSPYGNEIGGTKEVIIDTGSGHLDLAKIMEGIKNALAVDLFGVISILDILTIIVAISITVWFLKVFAGG